MAGAPAKAPRKPGKSSPDYDPITEALDIGFGLGRDKERERQAPKLEAARRGGRRTGQATANKTIERERRERAAKADAQREARRRRREEELASARRGAFTSGQAKAKRDAEQEASTRQRRSSTPRRSSGSGSTLSAPSFSLVGDGGGGLDRATSARIIIVVIGVSAVGSVAYSAMHKAPAKSYTKVGNETIAVPTHLRALGGVFIAGTVALVVNEVSPPLGLALALILGIDVVLTTFTGKGGLFNALGGGLFGATTGAAGSSGAVNAPTDVPHQTPPHTPGGTLPITGPVGPTKPPVHHVPGGPNRS
jgi:hypothetical protein